MEKSSKIICLGILVFLGLIIMPLLGFKDALNAIFPVLGSIIVAYGIYSKGPEFRETHHKSYLAMILGIALFILFFLLILLAGSALSIPYLPSLISLLLLGAIVSFGYGIFSYIRSPEHQEKVSRKQAARLEEIREKEESAPAVDDNGYDKWEIPRGIFGIIVGILFVWFAIFAADTATAAHTSLSPGYGLFFIAGIIVFFAGIYKLIMGIVHFIKKE